MRTDDEIRRRLGPLAEHEPSDAELAALRARLSAARRRRPPRVAIVVTGAAAVAALVVALTPAAREAERPGTPPLVAVAAVAAQRPVPPVEDAPYRYTRIRRTTTYEVRRGDRVGGERYETDVETWVGARWRGREKGSASRRALFGDIALAQKQFRARGSMTEAYERPYAYGDGPLARLDPRTLPEDRETLARELTEGIRTDRWGPYAESRGRSLGMPEDITRSVTAHHTILLLVYARLTGVQRAALLDMLSTQAPARDLGTVTDAIGRQGRGVELAFPITDPRGVTHKDRYRIVFDPATAEVLEWSMERHGGVTPWSPRNTDVVLDTGWARRIGEPGRPA